jgi:hypothetical protein
MSRRDITPARALTAPRLGPLATSASAPARAFPMPPRAFPTSRDPRPLGFCAAPCAGPTGRTLRRTASSSRCFPCASYHGRLIAVLRRARASPIKGRHPYLVHLSTAGLPRLALPPAVSSAPPPNHSPTRVRRRASKPTRSLARTQHPRPAYRPGRAAHSPEHVLQQPADRATAEPPCRLWSETLRARKLSPGDLQAIPRPHPADPAAGVRRIPATRSTGHGQGRHCKGRLLSRVFFMNQWRSCNRGKSSRGLPVKSNLK